MTEEQIDAKERRSTTRNASELGASPSSWSLHLSRPTTGRRKFYYDGGQVEIVAHLVYELDPNGKQLRVVRYTDYAG